VDPDDLSARAIASDGVLVVPASLFGMAEPYVRLGLGRHEFAPALDALLPLLMG
jgi:aspartate/methionine/tyrosine aminotransferase